MLHKSRPTFFYYNLIWLDYKNVGYVGRGFLYLTHWRSWIESNAAVWQTLNFFIFIWLHMTDLFHKKPLTRPHLIMIWHFQDHISIRSAITVFYLQVKNLKIKTAGVNYIYTHIFLNCTLHCFWLLLLKNQKLTLI